jgi:hypothetical protein
MEEPVARRRLSREGLATRHLGLRLAPEVGGELDLLIADEQKRTPFGNVSASSFVVGLIRAEYRRRSKTLSEHMDDVDAAVSDEAIPKPKPSASARSARRRP